MDKRDKLLEIAVTEQPQIVITSFGPDISGVGDACCGGIALVDDYALSRFCLIESLRQSLPQDLEIRAFSTVQEALSSGAPQMQMMVLCTHRQTEQQVEAALEASKGTEARLLVVTDEKASELWAFFKEALRAGICGFVSTTDTEFRTLNAAIEFVLKGGVFVPPEFFMHDSPRSYEPRNGRRTPDQLTNRQADVFSKLREGKPNKLIAYELNMSESTVKVHLRNILRTIGATNRTQAVFKAQAHHLRLGL